MITNDNYWDDVKWDLKAFLRNEVTDPESGNRSANDPFIWVGDTDAEVGSEDHKVPFVTLVLEDGDNRNLGPSKMGRSDDFQATLIIRVIGGLEHKSLAGDVLSAIKDALDDQNTSVSPTGTGPDGRDYDISVLSDPNFTQPNDRSQYRDDNYKEVAMQATFDSWFVN